MNNPVISVLIPVYRVEEYIEKCILSILNQTINQEIEIILVNDNTPDRSIDILNSLLIKNPPKSNITIQIIHHKENLGQTAARLTALNQAKGTYIIYIDSDDYIDNDMLEKMYLKAIQTNADIVMVDLYKEFQNQRLIIKAPYSSQKKEILSAFIRGTSIYLCNKLINRLLFQNHSSYFKEGYNMSEDYAIMIPLSFSANKIEFVPNTYYHYIQYNINATTKKTITQNDIDSWLYSVKCLEIFLKKYNITEYEKDVLIRKFTIRYWCIKNTYGEKQNKFSNLYPEINKHAIYLTKHIAGIRGKITFYLVAKGYIKCLNTLKRFNVIKLF